MISQQLLHQGRQLRFGYLGQFQLWARHGLQYTSALIRDDSYLPGLNEKLHFSDRITLITFYNHAHARARTNRQRERTEPEEIGVRLKAHKFF